MLCCARARDGHGHILLVTIARAHDGPSCIPLKGELRKHTLARHASRVAPFAAVCACPSHGSQEEAAFVRAHMHTRGQKRQRPRSNEDYENLKAKYNKLLDAWNNVVACCTCSITQGLPVQPCVTRDGSLHEHGSINAWISRKGRGYETSPNTGLALRPFTQNDQRFASEAMCVKHIISCIVDSGCLECTMLRDYVDREKKLEMEWVEGLKREVDTGYGDAGNAGNAARELSRFYRTGGKYISKDDSLMIYYLEKGVDLQHCTCEAVLGYCYALGLGVDKNYSMAIYLLQCACLHGSELGHFHMGTLFESGGCGMPKDAANAIKYYKLMPRCQHSDCSVRWRDQAKAALLNLSRE